MIDMLFLSNLPLYYQSSCRTSKKYFRPVTYPMKLMCIFNDCITCVMCSKIALYMIIIGVSIS